MRADAEIALELGTDGEIARCGAAVEIVDLGGSNDSEEIVAGNVFNRAVAFGELRRGLRRAVSAEIVADGQPRGTGEASTDFNATLSHVDELLAVCGERLRPRDRLIMGSIVQVPISAGDHVIPDLEALEAVELHSG